MKWEEREGESLTLGFGDRDRGESESVSNEIIHGIFFNDLVYLEIAYVFSSDVHGEARARFSSPVLGYPIIKGEIYAGNQNIKRSVLGIPTPKRSVIWRMTLLAFSLFKKKQKRLLLAFLAF